MVGPTTGVVVLPTAGVVPGGAVPGALVGATVGLGVLALIGVVVSDTEIDENVKV